MSTQALERKRRAVTIMVLLMLGMVPGASAQRVVAPTDSLLDRVYAIPEQPLDRALAAFGRQSGLQVDLVGRVDGMSSSPVGGRYNAAVALRMLLASTPMVAEFGAAGRVTIVRGASGAYSVASIDVVARRSSYRDSGVRVMGTSGPLRDAPVTATVVGRSLIDDQAMQGLGDVLQSIPGAQMGQGEGHRDQPTLRGNSSTSGFFVDGIRDDVQYVRDLYNLERVEGLMGANALAFGRGMSGGVINRVTKKAGRSTVRELRLSAGSFGGRRGAIDVGQPLTQAAAFRLNAMLEHSDLFRRGAAINRYGVNPTATVTAGERTMITAGVEHFNDDRTVDRGIPSLGGAPLDVDPATFFGSASLSPASATVTSVTGGIEHRSSNGVLVTSLVRYAAYRKFYQNVFPGAVNDARTAVRIAAYNSATDRQNLLSQTELMAPFEMLGVRHSLLAGVSLGRQATDNYRKTGYFHNVSTSTEVSIGDPLVRAPVTFRQSASDADNHVDATSASLYVQDHAQLHRRWQVFAGIGAERFTVELTDHRTGTTIDRTDVMISPRGGVVFKPSEAVAIHASHGVTALPSSGDQFSSLNATTANLEPEAFTNREVGIKWEATPRFWLTAVAYQLDRSKSLAPDPVDPSRSVQSGSQRSRGVEIGAQGDLTDRWQVAGGYALQHAEVTGRTAAAALGAQVPLVPRHALSLWNRVRFSGSAGAGLGITHRGRIFASFDNAVTLPAFTRVDAAGFLRLTTHLELQANIENVFGTRYYLTAHNNNNITPGSPRAVRLSLRSGF